MVLPKPTLTMGLQFTPTIHHDTYAEIEPSTKSNLEGQTVFVTGASKGIGRATVTSYAKAGAKAIGLGARSDLSSIEQEIKQAATQAGRKIPDILSVKLDVQDRASIEAAAGEVQRAFGNIDILVNNAGYLSEYLPIAESDPDEWWKTYEINMRGIYLMTRAFIPLLLAGSGKTILNLSSVGAHAITPGGSSYQITKLATLRFAEYINEEYGDRGLLAYSVHPGGIMTELAKGMPKDRHGILTDTPEVAADSIVYLTQKRQEWLAGRYVSCTWDMPELFKKREEILNKDLLRIRMALE